MVKLVDAEDIANDKIRTHDLALEINNITKQLNTRTLDPSSQEQPMFTQPKDPNNKNYSAYKKIVHIVIEQIIPFLLVSKNNEMMKTNEMHMLDQNLHKNHLYSTFVLLQMIEQNTMIIDTEVEVPHETILTTKTIHKIITVLHLEIDLAMTKVPLLHSTYKRDSRSYRSPYRSSYRSPYRHNSRPRYRSRSYSRDNKFTKYTNSYRPPSRPIETRFSRSRSHSNPRNKINMIQQEDQTDL